MQPHIFLLLLFKIIFNKVKIAWIEDDLILQTTLFILDFYKVTIWNVGIHFESFEPLHSQKLCTSCENMVSLPYVLVLFMNPFFVTQKLLD